MAVALHPRLFPGNWSLPSIATNTQPYGVPTELSPRDDSYDDMFQPLASPNAAVLLFPEPGLNRLSESLRPGT
jgi:hypothetical protein